MRPVNLIITMIERIQARRLLMKDSLLVAQAGLKRDDKTVKARFWPWLSGNIP